MFGSTIEMIYLSSFLLYVNARSACLLMEQGSNLITNCFVLETGSINQEALQHKITGAIIKTTCENHGIFLVLFYCSFSWILPQTSFNNTMLIINIETGYKLLPAHFIIFFLPDGFFFNFKLLN